MTNPAYRSHFGERLGILPRCFTRTNPRSIWLHAVSAGEVISAIPLIEKLRADEPRVPVYLSTSTLAGRALAERRLSTLVDGIFYCPLDYLSCVRRVLKTIRPALLIVLETEIWPNLYAETRRSGAGLAIVNGRISSRTWPRYRRLKWFFKPILQLPNVIFTQTAADSGRYGLLGVMDDRRQCAGNLKYDAASTPPESILPIFGAESVWIAASTVGPNERGSVHKHAIDEDDIVLDSFQTLAKDLPKFLVILAPRQPSRFEEVAKKLETRGLRFARRTSLPSTLELPAVLLLDTLGELAGAYRLAHVAFVGGSIAPRGGHNILEPASAGLPIVIGPNMQNFEDIARDFLEADAIVQIKTAAELTPSVRELITHSAEAHAIGDRARQVVLQQQGVCARVAECLWPIYFDANLSPIRVWFTRAVLGLLAALWTIGGYKKRRHALAHAHSLPAPVISVGGITIGGSGKTPFTNYLAARLRALGYSPAILTRGYRRRSPAENLVFAPGVHVPTAMTGDEAQIFLRAAKAPIGIGSNRWETGAILSKEFPQTDVFVLDDGFQHARLRRNFDIVVIDGMDPFGQCEVVPLGRLREPLSALRRANAFVVTRAENALRYRAISERLHQLNPHAQIFRTRLSARQWRGYTSGERLDALGTNRVAAFCALGNPHSFWATLESLGLNIVFRWNFPDHHAYKPLELQRLAHQARLHGAEILVTTEKDRVNIPDHLECVFAPLRLAWLEIEFALDGEEALFQFLEQSRASLSTESRAFSAKSGNGFSPLSR